MIGLTDIPTAFASPPPADWDAWLGQCAGEAGFCQSSQRAAMVHARRGAVSHILSVDEAGARVAGVLLSHFPGAASGNIVRSAESWLVGRGDGEIACFEGPVLMGANKPDLLRALLERVDELAGRLGVWRIRFAGRPVMADWGDDAAIAAAFAQFGYRCAPWLTSVIDLARSEDEIFATCKHAARQGVRKCRAAGLEVAAVAGYDDYARRFHSAWIDSVVAETGRRPDHADDRSWWEIDGGRHYRFLIAHDRAGAVHAVLGTYSFNGVATEIMSGRTTIGRATNLPAQDLLHWQAFLRHKAQGDRCFNLAGYSPAPVNAKEDGIRGFKAKWGGSEIAVPQYTRDDPPLRFRLLRRLAGRE
jgi:hypothetical protein